MPRSRRPSRAPFAAAPRVARLLITAGPTHEPIDSVRYIANRSSGRLGVALADHAAARGCTVTLLLGPTGTGPSDSRVRTERFRTAADLQRLLRRHFRRCDALVMAAAVADYRIAGGAATGKLRRGGDLTLRLEPTPDLVAECAAHRRPGQVIVGFALESARGLAAAARKKLQRKGLNLVVANPLRTMDSTRIRATLIDAGHTRRLPPMPKKSFARRLITEVVGLLATTGRSAKR